MVDLKDLKRALIAAGFEVLRTRGEEIHLAERHNVSLMEAGVRVRGGEAPGVFVVARVEKSDAASVQAEQLFELVRSRTSSLVAAGFCEVSTEVRELRSVSDEDRLTDTFYEVTFSRAVPDIDGLLRYARLAISAERYVVP